MPSAFSFNKRNLSLDLIARIDANDVVVPCTRHRQDKFAMPGLTRKHLRSSEKRTQVLQSAHDDVRSVSSRSVSSDDSLHEDSARLTHAAGSHIFLQCNVQKCAMCNVRCLPTTWLVAHAIISVFRFQRADEWEVVCAQATGSRSTSHTSSTCTIVT